LLKNRLLIAGVDWIWIVFDWNITTACSKNGLPIIQ
jgi:hypothetical protein